MPLNTKLFLKKRGIERGRGGEEKVVVALYELIIS